MENLAAAATILGLVIAASLLAGALVATRTALPPRLAAAITAFGGGVLLSAIALELVPDADQAAGPWLTAAGMLAGRWSTWPPIAGSTATSGRPPCAAPDTRRQPAGR